MCSRCWPWGNLVELVSSDTQVFYFADDLEVDRIIRVDKHIDELRSAAYVHAPRERGDGCAAADDAPNRAIDLDEGIVSPDLLVEVLRPGVEGIVECLESSPRSLDAGQRSIAQQVLLAPHDHTIQRGCHCPIICISVCLHH
jgi:hypothetical protein